MSQAATRHGPRPCRLRAVLFDFDGTLTRPGALDFAAIKREVGCPPGRYVLEWIRELPEGRRREEALADLERFELAAAAGSTPNDGAEGLVRRLRERGLALGVITRNGRAAVERALERFNHVTAADFGAIVTRDDDVAPKPAPDGVLLAARSLGVAAEGALVVGDHPLDMEAGRAAGALTVFLTNGRPAPGEAEAQERSGADFVVHGLAELDAVVGPTPRLPAGEPPGGLPTGALADVRC